MRPGLLPLGSNVKYLLEEGKENEEIEELRMKSESPSKTAGHKKRGMWNEEKISDYTPAPGQFPSNLIF